MIKVVVAICIGVQARIGHWLRACALVASIAWRMVALVLASAGRLPPMRQQLLDAAVELRWQPGEHVFEVGPRVAPAQLGTLQQAHHHRSALAGQLAANKEPVTPFMHL